MSAKRVGVGHGVVSEQSSISGNIFDRTIAITFDDLPIQQPVRIPFPIHEINHGILTCLTTNQVPAIGFVNEQLFSTHENVDESVLEMWLDAGMDLGNHTFSHSDLHKVSLREYFEDITRGECLTRRFMKDKGLSLRYFRHTHLHTGTTAEMRYAVEEFLSSHGYTVAPVTVAGHDWIFTQVYDKAKFEEDTNVIRYVGSVYVPYMEQCLIFAEENSVTLFGHEIPQILLLHLSSLNTDYLDQLLAMIKGRGYKFVNLSTALANEAYLTRDDYIGPHGLSWLQRWAITMGKELRGFPREPDTLLRLYVEADI
jgi:peptidoglycan/xylan/chitin deacetylase (PgdA/CDA1 family)